MNLSNIMTGLNIGISKSPIKKIRPPKLPREILDKTRARYEEALERITG